VAPIVARVQSHPNRRDVRQRLLDGLAGIPTEVIEDEVHPWSGYRKCLDAPPPGATHLLIVQDDALPCKGIADALPRIAAAQPNSPVCLYVGMLPPQKGILLHAAKAGQRYATLSSASAFLPVVAVLWPVKLAQSLLEWTADRGVLRRRNGVSEPQQSDDAMAGTWWRKHRRVLVVATIPSLFEHPDDVKSIVKPHAKIESLGRTALFWHGEEWDAGSIDWET
jgi:hypothetical protein